MKTEKLNHIQNRLQEWRDNTQLTRDYFKKDFVVKILENLTNYARAKNDLDRVHSLCEITILCLNAYEVEYILSMGENSSFYDLFMTIPTFLLKPNTNKAELQVVSHGADVIVTKCINFIKKLGFKPYKCLLENLDNTSRADYTIYRK